jgi:general stress protein CsbA
MSHRNHGGVFSILLGLFGVLIVIAGLSMLLGSRNDIVAIGIAVVPIVIGGVIVSEVLKSQKKG